MPRRKSPQKLEDLCIEAVVKNLTDLKSYWTIEEFRSLPVPFIEKLFKCMKRHGVRVQYENLDWFIHPRLKKLNFTDWSYHTNYTVTINNLLARTSKNLSHLDITSCDFVSFPELFDLIHNIPNVVNLNIRKTRCDDFILEQIGSRCPLVRELDVTGCEVTDLGMLRFCLDAKGVSRDLKIHTLNVRQTRMTGQGCATALKYLSCLKTFQNEHIDNALKFLDDDLCGAQLTLLLENMECGMQLSNKSLEIAAKRCPNIKEISFTSGSEENLRSLSNFANLEKLSLSPCNQFGVTFNGIIPMFENIGLKLVELTLSSVPQVDLFVIGSCCPKLEKIDLLRNSYCTLKTSRMDRILFTELRNVMLHSARNIPPEQLELLLQYCPYLESCELFYCNTLTDALFSKILDSNPMTHLTKLHFYRCDLLTSATIKNLLNSENDLTEITVTDCHEITRTDSYYIGKKIQANNWDVRMHWHMKHISTWSAGLLYAM